MLVVTAVAMFPLIAALAFAIDVSHWFDYSRNLQNRADAAALAAGTAYGNLCWDSSDLGDTQTGAQSVIGKWAQLYSGAGIAEPSVNLPYSDAQVSALPTAGAPTGPGTGYDVTGLGYINNTKADPLRLKQGPLANYHVLLNANNYSNHGGVNFKMGDFCSSNPALDETDPSPGTACMSGDPPVSSPPCAMADVKVTQEDLAPFVPIFNFRPNPSAKARVELEQIQSEKGVRPIAVRDASFIPCITANFLDADNGILQTAKLIKPDPTKTLWTSVGNPVPLTMPASDPVTVQLFLNDCKAISPDGVHYSYIDDKGKEQQLGLVYLNNWGNPTDPGANGTPVIDTGGVRLSSLDCDPYYNQNSSDCHMSVEAHVKFDTSATSTFVRAVMDDGAKGGVAQTKDLGNSGGNTWTSAAADMFAVPPDSGPHPVTIYWAQLGGKVAGDTCATTDGNQWKPANKCQGSLGVQQRTFSGVNGTNLCTTPNFDTGPIQQMIVGDADAAPGLAEAYAGGSKHNVYVSANVIGLNNSPRTSGPGDDICLRVAESDSHATGFVDCGQGKGTPKDSAAVVNGCPTPPGVQKNTRVQPDGSLTCTPQITPWDCVQNDPGQSPPILQSFDQLMNSPNCTPNHWNETDASGNPVDITLADPRAIVMIITAPTDMAVAHGTSDIPIRDFAVFYVTGWSTGAGVKGCTNGTNDAEPGGGGPPGQDGKIWGHWTSIAVPSGLGTSNGKKCEFDFGNCIAVLTR